jgi:hypothetical protein
MTAIEEQRERLLTELHHVELTYNAARQSLDWDTAQAAAMYKMNLCRRLYLLELQEKQEP